MFFLIDAIKQHAENFEEKLFVKQISQIVKTFKNEADKENTFAKNSK